MWEIPNLIFLLLLLHISAATSQPICAVSGETFANNSTYEANLNTLIASLSSGGIGGRRFLNTSVGHSPDTVNAVVVCRGNISLPACRKCVAAAAPATAQRCPSWKEAIFWNETCMFKYSDKPIFGGVINIHPVSHLPTKRFLLQNTDYPSSKLQPEGSPQGMSKRTKRIIGAITGAVSLAGILAFVVALLKCRK